ncbi:hypothetical protein ES703_94711 [subsurface metagenome]
MADGKKAGLAVGLAALLGGVVLLAKGEKPEEPEKPPEEEAAKIVIEIFDAEGNPVPTNSPAVVDEGQTYTARATITNNSTKAGTPWEATFDIQFTALTAYASFYERDLIAEHFTAGQTRSFDFTGITIPIGSGPGEGQFFVAVFAEGNRIAEGSEALSIGEVAIDYGATVVIGL